MSYGQSIIITSLYIFYRPSGHTHVFACAYHEVGKKAFCFCSLLHQIENKFEHIILSCRLHLHF